MQLQNLNFLNLQFFYLFYNNWTKPDFPVKHCCFYHPQLSLNPPHPQFNKPLSAPSYRPYEWKFFYMFVYVHSQQLSLKQPASGPNQLLVSWRCLKNDRVQGTTSRCLSLERCPFWIKNSFEYTCHNKAYKTRDISWLPFISLGFFK